MMRAFTRREQLTFLEDNHRQPSRDSIKYSLWGASGLAVVELM
jgi:hypothetical protein